jgi:predicted transcriptional regulator
MEIDPLEIMANVLRSALTELPISKIQRPTYLSYARLQEYLELLQNEELIKYNKRTGLYLTTEKGKRYLQECDEIQKLLSPTKEMEQERPQFQN